MNQIEAIREAGIKAAKARHRNLDEVCARFHHDWARRAIRLEDDPKAAERAFTEAYKEEASYYLKRR